jgi:hypothetical protein
VQSWDWPCASRVNHGDVTLWRRTSNAFVGETTRLLLWLAKFIAQHIRLLTDSDNNYCNVWIFLTVSHFETNLKLRDIAGQQTVSCGTTNGELRDCKTQNFPCYKVQCQAVFVSCSILYNARIHLVSRMCMNYLSCNISFNNLMTYQKSILLHYVAAYDVS